MLEILLVIGAFTLFTSKKNTVKTEIKETPTKLIKGTPKKTKVIQLQTQSGLDVLVPTNNFALPPKDSVQSPQIIESPVIDDSSLVDASQASSVMTQSGISTIKNLGLSFI